MTLSPAERFLRACRRQPVDCTPVWLMRQAGRYMEEYRRLRDRYPFLTLCKTPDLAAEVTLQPVRRLGVDAAIIFADILLPLEGMGAELRFGPDEGPVIANPVRTAADVERLRVVEPEEAVPYVLETVRLVRRELDGKVAVIGFAGAPFTLASYLVEGGSTRDFLRCKRLMWEEPGTWHRLLDKLAEVVLRYLRAQVRAGAQAVQLFDSWAGALAPDDYEDFVLPHSRRVLEGLRPLGVPVIHFAYDASPLLDLVRQAGGDVIGLDWRIDIGQARERLGDGVAVQGNLDPAALFAPPAVIEEKVRCLLARAGDRPGHVFNLGHGVHKETPVEHVAFLVEAVHRLSRRPLPAPAGA